MGSAYHLFKLGSIIAKNIKQDIQEQEAYKLKVEQVKASLEIASMYPLYEVYTDTKSVTELPDFRTSYTFEEREEIWKKLRNIEKVLDEEYAGRQQFQGKVIGLKNYLMSSNAFFLNWKCPNCQGYNDGDRYFYRCYKCKKPSQYSILTNDIDKVTQWAFNNLCK